MKRIRTIATLALAGLLGACAGTDETREETRDEAPPMKGETGQYFPTGDKASSMVRVEREMSEQIWAGHPYQETIKVTNLTSRDLHDVVLREHVGEDFRPGEDLGGAEFKDGTLTWRIERLAAKETRELSMSGTLPAEGEFRSCLEVELRPQACETRQVAVAKLDASASGPEGVLVCEPLPYTVTLRNDGTAPMKDVWILSDLPDGLKTEADDPALRYEAGDLAPGETKEIFLKLKAAKPGDYAPAFTARAGPVTKEVEAPAVKVREPVLTLEQEAPAESYAGGTGEAKITVTNGSEAPSHETVVEHRFPGDVRIVGASEGGEAAEGKAVWELGTLEPGESRTLSVVYGSDRIGTVEGVTTAKGHCARVVEARSVTAFKGVPAILVEVVDSPDPVRSEDDAAVYKIRVTNQGTVKLTQIKVDCRMEGVEAEAGGEGATEGTADGGRVEFAPVAELGPGESAEWTVSMRTPMTADARFRVEVNADQIAKPVVEEESTHFVR